jgi:hypothetical protein
MNFEKRVNEAIREMIQLGYKPKAFMTMIVEYNAIDAVKRLVNSDKISDGFVRLWELERLDLSMENIIQENEWNNLFTKEEQEKAKKRLMKYGYN